MHIVFVEVGYPRAAVKVGGAGTYVKLISDLLVANGHKVSIVCGVLSSLDQQKYLDNGKNIYPIINDSKIAYFLNKIPLLNILSHSTNYLITGYTIYKCLKRINNFDKINVVEYSEGGDFWNSIYKEFPYISHLHGSSFVFKLNCNLKVSISEKLKRKLELYFISVSDYVISPSNSMLSIVTSELRKKAFNGSVIPYPQFLLNFNLLKNNFKKKINILFASRNDRLKGGDLLIEAIKMMPLKYNDIVDFHFLGYTSNQDLKKIDNIQFVEFLPHTVFLNFYNSIDISVVPSLFDNSPYTVYEAMSAGKLVVASNVGGIPELIIHNKTGLLFQNNSSNDLCNKLIDAINLVSNQKDNYIRNSARDFIKNNSDPYKNLDIRLKYYFEISRKS